MKKEIKLVYVFNAVCSYCNKTKTVYYTVPDFGDAPHIMHCKNCNTLYWYTTDDEAYIQPIDEQIEGLKCENCKSDLKTTLVPTHKNISCCGIDFSLDDNFAGNEIPPDSLKVPVSVYLIYS